ncbi:MAG TPA: hypothetical protein VNX15_07560 [Gemmatimonadales bacterium]|nr:hypothetical protein [Gemmatimonadales bacterium]
MKSVGMGDVGVWAVLVAGLVALVVALFVTAVPSPALGGAGMRSARAATLSRYPADSLRRGAVARDVFRADRRPAAVAYDPSRGAAPLPDGPPKPQLTLTGVVWGEVPEAVIEGLPTASGPRVVRVGDVVGSVTVKRIEQTWVMVVGFDTTWTLTVREPWK